MNKKWKTKIENYGIKKRYKTLETENMKIKKRKLGT